ncbi:MAG: FAD:protein FMN transferase [Candidatus Omnitrophica bacterium]|nr:FAD:protein FMN transferase [Candidatus Omnitrophota bacterium]
MLTRRIFSLVLVLLALNSCGFKGKERECVKTEALMGTFVQIKAYSDGLSQEKLNRAVDEAFKKALELEKKFSIFYPESEVNALNISKRREVSIELYDIVEKSIKISELTGGEFDITVAPILKADGFYADMPAGIKDLIPDSPHGVGWRNIIMNSEAGTITLINGAWIDLSAIAKGYIVDRLSELLQERRIEKFLINAGGDIYCADKAKEALWHIGVRKPVSGGEVRTSEEGIIAVLGLKKTAVATSGDYENVVFDPETGEVESHIIDPLKDEPRTEVPSSITVIGPRCALADALATGMMAMGREKAIDLADTLSDIEIIVVENPEGKAEVSFSKGAKEYVLTEQIK